MVWISVMYVHDVVTFGWLRKVHIPWTSDGSNVAGMPSLVIPDLDVVLVACAIFFQARACFSRFFISRMAVALFLSSFW